MAEIIIDVEVSGPSINVNWFTGHILSASTVLAKKCRLAFVSYECIYSLWWRCLAKFGKD